MDCFRSVISLGCSPMLMIRQLACLLVSENKRVFLLCVRVFVYRHNHHAAVTFSAKISEWRKRNGGDTFVDAELRAGVIKASYRVHLYVFL